MREVKLLSDQVLLNIMYTDLWDCRDRKSNYSHTSQELIFTLTVFKNKNFQKEIKIYRLHTKDVAFLECDVSHLRLLINKLLIFSILLL